ncbi:MAG: hypothetical protein CVU55_15785 [Deltaproteobacteria bacterium HGW-Deltaproteobacteria-13]|jgi:hypothetical protein|nr:MAG: hypothetical protein CVU55_15785 [Deltaproteobacteria bacterium HGW-Deltaproteobacteria-13]
MSKIKNYFIFTLIALIVCPFIAFAQSSVNPEQNPAVVKKNVKKPAGKVVEQPKSAQAITPLELNLGTINIDKSGEGSFLLKNSGSRAIDWSTGGPEGWESIEKQKLSGVLKNNSDSLRVEIRLLPKESEDKQKIASNYNNVEMKLEAGGGKLVCRKEFPGGAHKETIKINSSDGQKIIFVTFIIGYTQKSPQINLNPLRLDMGSVLPEKIVSKKIIASNSGREMLTWSVAVKKHEIEDKPASLNKGRYISFLNEEVRGSGVYAVPGHMKESFEFVGKWMENEGYPTGAEGENLVKIHFSGTGIILYLLTGHKEANMALSLDKNVIDDNKLFKDWKERKGELIVAKDLTDGPHILTITGRDNHLGLEGIRILGDNIAYFPYGSIKIVPNSGAITRQTNYLNVSLNTAQMSPGYYMDHIVFNTNGGEAIVEVSAEVLPDNTLKVVDIYRYYNGTDYLFTDNPQSEARRLIQNNYVKEGIAFRLFKPGTPGTIGFYRWYNPQSRSHFYHYDSSGGKKDLRGYIFEGSIGNIATSRLTNTRELYRWYNSKTGHYFYSTDIQGGAINKKAYRFDGIAGYVK